MLPDGVSAGLLPTQFRQQLLDHHLPARDAIELARGGCACDLAGRRLASVEEDERALRARYRARSVPRSLVIRAFDAHRRRPARSAHPAEHWPSAFASFVAEHARNAGPALYYLDFTVHPDRPPRWPADAPRQVTAGTVRLDPVGWLQDETPTVVTP